MQREITELVVEEVGGSGSSESSPGTEWIILWLGEVQESGLPPGLEQLGMVVSGLAFGTQLSPRSLLWLLAWVLFLFQTPGSNSWCSEADQTDTWHFFVS